MSTVTRDPANEALLPDCQEDMFFTWDSGGNGGEYLSDSFVHTAVELPKYCDHSIITEEQKMIMLYAQNDGTQSANTHSLLGSDLGDLSGKFGQRTSGDMSTEKSEAMFDPQGAVIRGFLETIVEENSDDLRSPSECDEGSLDWGSWDESSEPGSGSDDDRITVVEMKVTNSLPSLIAKRSTSGVAECVSLTEDSEKNFKDKFLNGINNKNIPKNSISDNESSLSLASFVDETFNGLWENIVKDNTNSMWKPWSLNACLDDSSENLQSAYFSPESDCETKNAKVFQKLNEDIQYSNPEDDSEKFSRLLMSQPMTDEMLEILGTDSKICLVPSAIISSGSESSQNTLREPDFATPRYVDSPSNHNFFVSEGNDFECKSDGHETLLSLEIAPTYLPDSKSFKQNQKIRCFRIGFGSEMPKNTQSFIVPNGNNKSDILEVSSASEEEKNTSESNDLFETMFSPREGDVSFGSPYFGGHFVNGTETMKGERHQFCPDAGAKNAKGDAQLTMMTSVSDSEEWESETSKSDETEEVVQSLSRWQHQTDLQRVDLEEVAKPVSRWQHKPNQYKHDGDLKLSSGKRLVEFIGETELLAKLCDTKEAKFTKVAMLNDQGKNVRTLGLWENETKITLPPINGNCSAGNKNSEHKNYSSEVKEDLDDLELDMFAVSRDKTIPVSGISNNDTRSEVPGTNTQSEVSYNDTRWFSKQMKNENNPGNYCRQIETESYQIGYEPIKEQLEGTCYAYVTIGENCEDKVSDLPVIYKIHPEENTVCETLDFIGKNLKPHPSEFVANKNGNIENNTRHFDFTQTNRNSYTSDDIDENHMSWKNSVAKKSKQCGSTDLQGEFNSFLRNKDVTKLLEMKDDQTSMSLSPCTSLDSDRGVDVSCSEVLKEVILTDTIFCLKHDDSGYVEDVDDEEIEIDVFEPQYEAKRAHEKLQAKQKSSFVADACTEFQQPKSNERLCTKLSNKVINVMQQKDAVSEKALTESTPGSSCVCSPLPSATLSSSQNVDYENFSEDLRKYKDTDSCSGSSSEIPPKTSFAPTDLSEFSSWLLDRELQKISSREMVDKLIEEDLVNLRQQDIFRYLEEPCFAENILSTKNPFSSGRDSPTVGSCEKVEENERMSEKCVNEYLKLFSDLQESHKFSKKVLLDSQADTLYSGKLENVASLSSTCVNAFETELKFVKDHEGDLVVKEPENPVPNELLRGPCDFSKETTVDDELLHLETNIVLDNEHNSKAINFSSVDSLTDGKPDPVCVNGRKSSPVTLIADPEANSVDGEVFLLKSSNAVGAEIINNGCETKHLYAVERDTLLQSLSSSPDRGYNPQFYSCSKGVPFFPSPPATLEAERNNGHLSDNRKNLKAHLTNARNGVPDTDCCDDISNTITAYDESAVLPSTASGINVVSGVSERNVAVATPLHDDLDAERRKIELHESMCLHRGCFDDVVPSFPKPRVSPNTGIFTLQENNTNSVRQPQHVYRDARDKFESIEYASSSPNEMCLQTETDATTGRPPKQHSHQLLSDRPESQLKPNSRLHVIAPFRKDNSSEYLTAEREISHPGECKRDTTLTKEFANEHSKSTPDLHQHHEYTSSLKPVSQLPSKSVNQRIQDYLGRNSGEAAIRQPLIPTERSCHYRRICISTETVVERAARFEARHRSSSESSGPCKVITGVQPEFPRKRRSESCPHSQEPLPFSEISYPALNSSEEGKKTDLLSSSIKRGSKVATKPTANFRLTKDWNENVMKNIKSGTCANVNKSSRDTKGSLCCEEADSLPERVTRYDKTSINESPLTQKLPPSNIRNRIARARSDFFGSLGEQDATNEIKTLLTHPNAGGLERFDNFRKSAREERVRLAASHPDLGALEAAVRSYQRQIDNRKKTVFTSKSDSPHDCLGRNEERHSSRVGEEKLSTTAGRGQSRTCTPYRRCTGEIAWATCARRLERERLKSRSQSYLETDVDSHLQLNTPAESSSGSFQSAEECFLRAHSLLTLTADQRPEPVAICEELHCNSRARSMDFLLDADNREAALPPENRLGVGQGRVKSEHELRIERSLQNLTIPEWYKQSPWSKKPKEGFILRRGSEGAAGESRKRWQGLRSSRTPSASSLSSSPYSQRNAVTPKRVTSSSDWRYVGSLMSSRESLPPASPASLSFRDCSAFQYGLSSLSRWGSSRLSTNSAPLSAWSVHRSFRQPYLGWRAAAAASSAQTPSSGGSRSSPAMSPAASTPLFGSRPVSPRRSSTYEHHQQSRDNTTLRPDSCEMGEVNRISPLALYSNSNGVFFTNAAELVVPQVLSEDGTPRVKIQPSIYEDRFRTGLWSEIRRDRYSYTQSLYNSATMFSPTSSKEENPLNLSMKYDQWATSPPPRIWMESSFVGMKSISSAASPLPTKSYATVDEKDRASEKSLPTSVHRDAVPTSTMKGTCAPTRQMGSQSKSALQTYYQNTSLVQYDSEPKVYPRTWRRSKDVSPSSSTDNEMWTTCEDVTASQVVANADVFDGQSSQSRSSFSPQGSHSQTSDDVSRPIFFASSRRGSRGSGEAKQESSSSAGMCQHTTSRRSSKTDSESGSLRRDSRSGINVANIGNGRGDPRSTPESSTTNTSHKSSKSASLEEVLDSLLAIPLGSRSSSPTSPRRSKVLGVQEHATVVSSTNRKDEAENLNFRYKHDDDSDEVENVSVQDTEYAKKTYDDHKESRKCKRGKNKKYESKGSPFFSQMPCASSHLQTSLSPEDKSAVLNGAFCHSIEPCSSPMEDDLRSPTSMEVLVPDEEGSLIEVLLR